MATVLALLYILDYGCGELAINFTNDYRASWLSIGVLGIVFVLIPVAIGITMIRILI